MAVSVVFRMLIPTFSLTLRALLHLTPMLVA